MGYTLTLARRVVRRSAELIINLYRPFLRKDVIDNASKQIVFPERTSATRTLFLFFILEKETGLRNLHEGFSKFRKRHGDQFGLFIFQELQHLVQKVRDNKDKIKFFEKFLHFLREKVLSDDLYKDEPEIAPKLLTLIKNEIGFSKKDLEHSNNDNIISFKWQGKPAQLKNTVLYNDIRDYHMCKSWFLWELGLFVLKHYFNAIIQNSSV